MLFKKISKIRWIYVGISVVIIGIVIFIIFPRPAEREGFILSYPREIANFNEPVEMNNIKKLKLVDVSPYRQYLQSIQPAIDKYVATVKPIYDKENSKYNTDKNNYVNKYNKDKTYKTKQNNYYKQIKKTHQQFLDQEYDSKMRDNNNKYNQLLQKQKDIRAAVGRITQKLDEREKYMNEYLINPDAPLEWCDARLCQSPYDEALF